MTVRLTLAFLCASMWVRPARADDRWSARDKALHFSATAGLAGGGYAAAAALSDDLRVRVATGLAVALAAGAAKELYDLRGHGDASWRDFAWDGIGSVTGVLAAYVVDWLLSE